MGSFLKFVAESNADNWIAKLLEVPKVFMYLQVGIKGSVDIYNAVVYDQIEGEYLVVEFGLNRSRTLNYSDSVPVESFSSLSQATSYVKQMSNSFSDSAGQPDHSMIARSGKNVYVRD